MDWSKIAAIAAGITGGFGLVGFIVYVVQSLTYKSLQQKPLTKGEIEALKNSGINPETVSSMSQEQLNAILQVHNELSKELINKVFAPELANKGRIALWIPLALIFLALVFGLSAFFTKTEKGGESFQPVQPKAKIETSKEMQQVEEVPTHAAVAQESETSQVSPLPEPTATEKSETSQVSPLPEPTTVFPSYPVIIKTPSSSTTTVDGVVRGGSGTIEIELSEGVHVITVETETHIWSSSVQISGERIFNIFVDKMNPKE